MLTLKKDLPIMDNYIAEGILEALIQNKCRYLFSESDALMAGTKLPTGPLHPIAALAFLMAGFILADPRTGNCYISWRKDEAPEEGVYCLVPNIEGYLDVSSSSEPVATPNGLVICSHIDPSVL